MSEKAQQILIVDDDPDVLEVTVDAATEAGFKVLAAKNGIEALELLEKHVVNVMISDIKMPGMTGVELFGKVYSRKIPTIFISGFADTLDLETALGMGASDFISKPFTNEEFLNSIEVALRGSEVAPSDEGEIHRQYCRVPIEEFLSGPTVPYDVYIRLAANRFLRIARADSPLSRQRINSYRAKGLNFLFIRKEHFSQYVGFNFNLAKAATSNKINVSRDRKVQLLKQTSEIFLENVFANGISREAFEEGREIVETTLRVLSDSDDLFLLLELVKKNSDTEFVQSLAVSVYSTLIAKKLGWTSSQTLFRVAMAGLLHDIGQRELPLELIKKYHTDRISLPDEQIRQYQSHPIRGHDMLLQIPGVPEDVPMAVLQHHENMGGTGYPNRPARLKLHPFSRILYLADSFCHELYSPELVNNDARALAAINKLFPARESEFDLQMLRALFQVLEIPIPEKIANYRAHRQ